MAKDKEILRSLYIKIKAILERRKISMYGLRKEEWQELGGLLKDWEPYTELIAKRGKSSAERYLEHVYGMDCSQTKKVDFLINKVVYEALQEIIIRNEIGNLGLADGFEICQKITRQMKRLLRQGRGEFSKKPVRKMREDDGRVMELCRKYLKNIGNTEGR